MVGTNSKTFLLESLYKLLGILLFVDCKVAFVLIEPCIGWVHVEGSQQCLNDELKVHSHFLVGRQCKNDSASKMSVRFKTLERIVVGVLLLSNLPASVVSLHLFIV